MRKITFHEEADAEVTEAARYYEAKSEGLGFSFLIELEAAMDQILANPEAYQRVGGEVRRKRLRRFPYNLLFVIDLTGFG